MVVVRSACAPACVLDNDVVADPGAIPKSAGVELITVGVLIVASGPPPPDTRTTFVTQLTAATGAPQDVGGRVATSTGTVTTSVSWGITTPENVHLTPEDSSAAPFSCF